MYMYICIYVYIYIYIYTYVCIDVWPAEKQRELAATIDGLRRDSHSCHILPFQPSL